MMRIVVTDNGAIVDAQIDVATRQVESLLVDDERLTDALKGLAVLCGCVEAVLRAEYEKKFPVQGSRFPVETATVTRPDVPTCEGGCE